MANIPSRAQVKLGVVSDWRQGRVAVCEGADLLGWVQTVTQAAVELGERLEIAVDPRTDLGFARVNKGFRIGLEPYSDEAKEWSLTQPGWREQHSAWNTLFGSAQSVLVPSTSRAI